MSTPPTYPFRSRREIHSGQPKVYSDAPNEDVTPTPSDPTPTPVRGTASPAHASHDAGDARLSRHATPAVSSADPTPTPIQGVPAETPARSSLRESEPRGEHPAWKPTDAASETTGMRSRRIASERRAARKRRRRRRIRSFFVIVLVLGLVGGASYFAYSQLMNSSTVASDDYPGPGTTDILVTIDDQATGRDIGQKLYEAGVVRSVGAFVRQYEKNSAARSINPGTYRFKLQMSAADALAVLLDPMNRVDSTVTVLAGERMSVIKKRIVDVMDVSEAEVEQAFANTAAIGLPAEAGGNVEGWLAPGTYDVAENATPKDLVKKMVSQTVTRLKELKVPKEDYQKVLIKASIVEREVNKEQYYGQVARVIENRLTQTDGETHGLLQMDSTVQYGLGRDGGIPSEAENQDASNPYNTYVHQGLPPGPIGNPDEAAIKAVLNPPAGSWLYFVTVNLKTGETLFASTNEEQKANTKKLSDYCNKNKDVCEGNESKKNG